MFALQYGDGNCLWSCVLGYVLRSPELVPTPSLPASFLLVFWRAWLCLSLACVTADFGNAATQYVTSRNPSGAWQPQHTKSTADSFSTRGHATWYGSEVPPLRRNGTHTHIIHVLDAFTASFGSTSLKNRVDSSHRGRKGEIAKDWEVLPEPALWSGRLAATVIAATAILTHTVLRVASPSKVLTVLARVPSSSRRSQVGIASERKGRGNCCLYLSHRRSGGEQLSFKVLVFHQHLPTQLCQVNDFATQAIFLTDQQRHAVPSDIGLCSRC